MGKGPWGEEGGSCSALGGSKLRVQRQLGQGLETLRGNREKLLKKRLGWGGPGDALGRGARSRNRG